MFDPKQLVAVFVEEAYERIAELEDGLLRLEKSGDDKELLNVIFRAAHTIKGSSGVIGLTEISSFTHKAEEVLDLVRKEKLIADKPLIDLLLEATDNIKYCVDIASSGGLIDSSVYEDLARRLEAAKGTSPAASSCVESTAIATAPEERRKLKIIFIPSPDLFKRGMDPSVVIRDLNNHGNVLDIKADTDFVPPISELDPEALHLRWDIVYKTDLSIDSVRQLFEFVEDGSEIRIFPMAESRAGAPLLGDILVDEGVVKATDIDEAVKAQKRLGEMLVQQGKTTPQEIDKALQRQNFKKADAFKNAVSSTIRVDLKRLDHLINAVGEMVIVHSMLRETIESGAQRAGGSDELENVFSQLQRIGSEIQERVMSLRMLPVGDVFQRFSRLVRELSASSNKEIELVITGEDTELDKGVLEKITDPLVHLIRNSIDHGLETPQARLTAGKARKGTLHLSAYQMGDSVYIDVEDDGRGLDTQKILDKAIAKGIVKDSSGMSEEQVNALIFLPGFSTADAVTDISGRGVGMDVVRKNIAALGGKIAIRTRLGMGTVISIKLPLTLAIIDGLKVMVGNETFVIPITSVLESLRPKKQDVKSFSERGELVCIRGEHVPLLRLHDELDIRPKWSNPWDAIVVLVAHEGRKRCLLVDELLGEQQIVIKSLGKATPKLGEIAGGTILGDGRVALVLDIAGLIERSVGLAPTNGGGQYES